MKTPLRWADCLILTLLTLCVLAVALDRAYQRGFQAGANAVVVELANRSQGGNHPDGLGTYLAR
jgi:hypothetical protein